MARLPSIDGMTSAELASLKIEIDQLIAQKREEARLALKAELVAMASSRGFDIKDVVGLGKGGRQKARIKFQDPNNPANKWSGRGRQPRWLVAALKARGAKLEDFLIK